MHRETVDQKETFSNNPFDYERISARFTRHLPVKLKSNENGIGVVMGVERHSATGSGVVVVKWNSTGISAHVHPSYIEPIETPSALAARIDEVL